MTKLLLSFVTLLAFAFPADAAEQRPNIVFIYGDDVGYGDLAPYGTKSVKTPHCDRIAREGLRFTNAYCTSATCTPSRYSLLTGEYAFRRKGTGVLPGDAGMIIEPGRTTLPAVMQQAGYRTGVVGKWHLGLGAGKDQLNWNTDIKPCPLDIGFDYSFIMAATGDRVPCVYLENRRVVNLDPKDPIQVNYEKPYEEEPTGVSIRSQLKMDWSHGHNMAVVNGVGRIGYMKGGKSALWVDENMADEYAKHAVKFIEESKDKPFFLYYATHSIHVPRVTNKRFAGQTTMGPRGDAIVEFDWQVGQVLETLDRLKLTDNTLVIISSDNGPVLDDGYKDDAVEKLGDHKPAGPLRGGKYAIYEGGTREPFLVRWPGKVKPGTSAAFVSQVDFTASFAALTGVKLKDADAPDSLNMLPAILGEDTKGRDHIIEHANRLAIRQGDWKFIGGSANAAGAKKGPAGPELYNLAEDVAETKNVAADHADKVAMLRKKLEEIRDSGRTRPVGK